MEMTLSMSKGINSKEMLDMIQMVVTNPSTGTCRLSICHAAVVHFMRRWCWRIIDQCLRGAVSWQQGMGKLWAVGSVVFAGVKELGRRSRCLLELVVGQSESENCLRVFGTPAGWKCWFQRGWWSWAGRKSTGSVGSVTWQLQLGIRSCGCVQGVCGSMFCGSSLCEAVQRMDCGGGSTDGE